jgi:hypothetical protein
MKMPTKLANNVTHEQARKVWTKIFSWAPCGCILDLGTEYENSGHSHYKKKVYIGHEVGVRSRFLIPHP